MDEKVDVQEKLDIGWLHCKLVIEVVGKPESYVEETMRTLLKKLREEKGLEIIEGQVHKPKEEANFFSSFVELECVVQDLSMFTTLCFEYMPSSVEIVKPDELKTKASIVTDFVNDMLARLHDVDMRFKNVNASNGILERNLYSLLANTVVLTLEKDPASVQKLATSTGVQEKELLPFLKQFVEKKIIKEENGLYSPWKT